MLEETSRSVENYSKEQRKHGRINQFHQELPKVSYIPESHLTQLTLVLVQHLHHLRVESSKKGVRLLFLPKNFTRRRANTSYLNWKTKHIDWRIEWRYSWVNVVTSDSRYEKIHPIYKVKPSFLH